MTIFISSDPDNPDRKWREAMSTPEATSTNSKPKMSLAKRVAIGGLVTLSLLGAGATYAISKDMGGMGGMGHGMFGGHDRKEFMEFRFNKMLGLVKATPEQSDKLKGIFEKVKTEMHPDGQDGGPRKMHEKVMELLAAPTVDKAAVEAVRTEQVANMEKKSKVITEALLEAADVLTPEQRATLVEEMKKHGPRD